MTMAIDHEYTKEIVCPYCGAEFLDSWEYGDHDFPECDCGKKFISKRDIDVTYITEKCPCLNGEAPHVWHSLAFEMPGKTVFEHRYMCRECTTERVFPGETRTEFEAFDENQAGDQ
jgi:hypothetical protein